jgi:recombinational DNA repair ATPase RecF
MVPPSSLSEKPPPEVQYAQAMVQIKKQEADAKTAMVGVKQQEVAAKLQEAGAGGAGEQGPTLADQLKIADIELKKQELQEKQTDSMMDALNRKRDRESRERLAAVKLAEDLAANPAGIPIVQSIIPQDMLERLESNEQPLTAE